MPGSTANLYGWITWGVALIVVLAPLLLLKLAGKAGLRWFGLGILSWLFALALRAGFGIGVWLVLRLSGSDIAFATSCSLDPLRMIPPLPLSPEIEASVYGLVAAVAEAVAVLWLIRHVPQRWTNVVMFGVGIATFETLLVLLRPPLMAKPMPALEAVLAAGLPILLLIDRALALIAHSAFRALIYVGQRARRVAPVVLGTMAFGILDGIWVYGLREKWNWSDTSMVIWLHLAMAALIGIATTMAMVAWGRMVRSPAKKSATGGFQVKR